MKYVTDVQCGTADEHQTQVPGEKGSADFTRKRTAVTNSSINFGLISPVNFWSYSDEPSALSRWVLRDVLDMKGKDKDMFCSHDWETVEEGVITEYDIKPLFPKHNIEFILDYNDYIKIDYDLYSIDYIDIRYKNIVCLKCNRCVDGKSNKIKELVSFVSNTIEKEKEKDRRKSLAKKMWRNCKHGSA
jgi:hypothetical protein